MFDGGGRVNHNTILVNHNTILYRYRPLQRGPVDPCALNPKCDPEKNFFYRKDNKKFAKKLSVRRRCNLRPRLEKRPRFQKFNLMKIKTRFQN